MVNLNIVLARRILLADRAFVTLFATPLLQVSHFPFKASSGDTLGWAEVRRVDPDFFGTTWIPSEPLLRSPLANRQADVTVLTSVRRAQSWLGVCTGGSK
jgi:hypothetical protein